MPKIIAPSFYFIGNHPAVDYMNTKVVSGGSLVDLLQSPEDVLHWLMLAGYLTSEETQEVREKWREIGEEGVEGNRLIAAAHELRDGLHTLVKQGMQGGETAAADMERINRHLESKVITTRLIRVDGGFASERIIQRRQPSDLLFPVAEAAIDLLTNYDLDLVRKCENPNCVLYFYDNSKNNARRWCSQKTCGNRMKVAAYLERKKQKEAKS